MKAIKTILLPGLYGTGELFDPLLQVAPENREISVITYPLKANLDFDQLVEIAENQIPADEPVQIVAESFSGLVAIRLLTRNQRNYKRVVFCAAFASSPVPGINWFKNPVLWLIRTWPGLVNLGVRYFCLNGSQSQIVVNDVSRVIKRIPVSLLQSRLEMISTLNLSNELQQIDVPSVYLLPSRDRLILRRRADELLKILHQWKCMRLTARISCYRLVLVSQLKSFLMKMSYYKHR